MHNFIEPITADKTYGGHVMASQVNHNKHRNGHALYEDEGFSRSESGCPSGLDVDVD